jgi:hypothetical protein
VDTSAYTWPDNKLTPSDICATINAALDHTNPTQVCTAAARWTAKGNLVIWGGANTMASQIAAALPHFAKALQASLSAMATSAPQSPPTIHNNIKWSKLCINAVPTGKTDTLEACSPEQVHTALASENPAYATLTIMQLPSWVRNPASYAQGSSSSLSFAFEDPDGSNAQHLLRLRTMYAFGHVITVKRWKDTPPKKKNPLKPPTTKPFTQAEGDKTPEGTATPSVYNPLHQPHPSLSLQKKARFKALAATKQQREHRGGPSSTT